MAVRQYVLGLSLGLGHACTPDPVADPPVWVVHPQGIGPVQAGMSVAEASRVLGEPVAPDYDLYDTRCAHVTPRALPSGVDLMMVDDTVVRVEVTDTTAYTAAGLGVGTPEAQLLARYAGRVRVRPHAYDGPEGHYVIVDATATDTTHAIVFETDGRTVHRFRAGRRPEVEWIEGCL